MLHYPCLSKFLNSHLQHMQYFIISKLLYGSKINTDLRNYWIFGINSLNIKFQLLWQIISECSIGKTFIVLWYSLSIFKSHNRPILTGKISDKDTVCLFKASASTIIFQFYGFVCIDLLLPVRFPCISEVWSISEKGKSFPVISDIGLKFYKSRNLFINKYILVYDKFSRLIIGLCLQNMKICISIEIMFILIFTYNYFSLIVLSVSNVF